MFRLPEDLRLDFLDGCYLELVSFGSRTTRLVFSRPQLAAGVAPYTVSLCIEKEFCFQVGDAQGSHTFSFDGESCLLLKLLSDDVTLLECTDGRSLKISFSPGSFILVGVDEDSDYESYSIYLDSGDVVVV